MYPYLAYFAPIFYSRSAPNPQIFTSAQHLATANREAKVAIRRLLQGTAIHESIHLFNPSGCQKYCHPESAAGFEGYWSCPDEIIAFAAEGAAWLVTMGKHPEAMLENMAKSGSNWSFYLKHANDPYYVQRHPTAKGVARRFDWLLKRYYTFFIQHWHEEQKLARALAAKAW